MLSGGRQLGQSDCGEELRAGKRREVELANGVARLEEPADGGLALAEDEGGCQACRGELLAAFELADAVEAWPPWSGGMLQRRAPSSAARRREASGQARSVSARPARAARLASLSVSSQAGVLFDVVAILSEDKRNTAEKLFEKRPLLPLAAWREECQRARKPQAAKRESTCPVARNRRGWPFSTHLVTIPSSSNYKLSAAPPPSRQPHE